MLRSPRLNLLDPIAALQIVLWCHENKVLILGLDWDPPLTQRGRKVDFHIGPDYSNRREEADPYNALIACRDIGAAIAEFGIENLLVDIVEEV